MAESLILTAAILCCSVGLAWLALAMKSHWRQVLGDRTLPHRTQLTLRLLGSGFIFTSLYLCLLADHPTMAALVWVMTLAASSVLVAFTLAYRPLLLLPLVAWINIKGQLKDSP